VPLSSDYGRCARHDTHAVHGRLSAYRVPNHVLHHGSRAVCVIFAQAFFYLPYCTKVDGVLGAQTLRATKHFQ
jgi:lysozyme family protein